MRAKLATATIALFTASIIGAIPASAHEQAFDSVEPATAEEKAAETAAAPNGSANCVNGVAADTYSCDGIDMLDHLWLDDLGLSFANDMWGWTDPATGTDYAIVGGTEGTVFVNLKNPRKAEVVGMLPTHVEDEHRPYWRDVKVHDNHAFVVAEQRPHGMQVFDLTRLRDESGTFTEDAHYDGFGNAHNVAINEDTGYAYAIGTNTCDGGLHMVDINDPTNPTGAGCYADDGYIHDTQCVTYSGPDADYQGRELCFNSNADRGGDGHFVSITDVTDKDNPTRVARVPYSDPGYSHQGWLTPDQKYFLHGDELDEVSHGNNTRTRIWDMRDLDDPKHIGTFDNDTTSIDHNIYIKNQRAYASNYTSGLRVYSTKDVASGELSEKAFFDVYPENDNASFEGGTWSNYPYFERDIVGVSTMDRGLFILKVK